MVRNDPQGHSQGFPIPTRSGPKIIAAGYLEDERFLDLKNLSFGLMAFKMALKVHNGKWLGT